MDTPKSIALSDQLRAVLDHELRLSCVEQLRARARAESCPGP